VSGIYLPKVIDNPFKSYNQCSTTNRRHIAASGAWALADNHGVNDASLARDYSPHCTATEAQRLIDDKHEILKTSSHPTHAAQRTYKRNTQELLLLLPGLLLLLLLLQFDTATILAFMPLASLPSAACSAFVAYCSCVVCVKTYVAPGPTIVCFSLYANLFYIYAYPYNTEKERTIIASLAQTIVKY